MHCIAYHIHFLSHRQTVIIQNTPTYLRSPNLIPANNCVDPVAEMADKAAGGHDEHESSSFIDSVKEKVSETFHGSGSSSSDSEGEGKGKDKLKAGKKDYPIPIKKKVQSLSWKEKPVHDLLGGGKPADVLLWRDKKTSIGVLGVATIIWALFELIEYHLLSLVCHILILVLGIHFLWSNTFNLFYRCPQFPEVAIEKDTALRVASILRSEINKALEVLREIASGKDLKEFLAVIAGLWVVSIAGNWCNLLTLVYICFVLLQMVPILYEKNKSQADVILGKAEGELKKHFEVVSEKVLSKVPSMSSREKKAA